MNLLLCVSRLEPTSSALNVFLISLRSRLHTWVLLTSLSAGSAVKMYKCESMQCDNNKMISCRVIAMCMRKRDPIIAIANALHFTNFIHCQVYYKEVELTADFSFFLSFTQLVKQFLCRQCYCPFRCYQTWFFIIYFYFFHFHFAPSKISCDLVSILILWFYRFFFSLVMCVNLPSILRSQH